MLTEHLRQRLDAFRALQKMQGTGWDLNFSLEAFVLRNAWPETVGQPRPKGVRRGTPKECFANAANLVTSRTDLFYMEGFCMGDSIPLPFHHAWAVDAAHRVIEPTLEDPTKYRYLGVLFPLPVLVEQLLKNKVYGLLDTGRGLNTELMRWYDEDSCAPSTAAA